MHILVIIALLAACFLSACSPVAPPGQEAEVSSPSPQATGGTPVAAGSGPFYFGEDSIEERIANHDTIVRASLDLTTRNVTTEVIRGQGEASHHYYVALKLPLTVGEYLKGSGADNITVVAIRGGNYDTEAEAEAAAPGFATNRVTTWDDREAVIFVNQADSDGYHSAAVQGADNYFLASGDIYRDGYSLGDRRRKLWLPSANTTASGDSREYMLAVPESGVDTPTITLGELKRQIAAVNAELNAGDGSQAYKDCIKGKNKLDREESHRLNQPNAGGRHSYEPARAGTFASGQLAGSKVYEYPAGGWANPADTTSRVWLTGTDASLFEVKHGDLRPGPDFNRDGDSDGFEFDVTIVSTRPVPAGTYEFTSNYIPWKFLKCEGTYSFPHTATVPLPEGVLHELFFDPVAVGSAVAADDTNGVLKPASFTGADGSSATIERISYEPPSAGSGRAGTVKLAITAGSDPDDLLGEHLLDFIELDGTVSLSLYVAAATVDTANDTLSWTASSQPWEDGDKLMLRIRRAPPSCSSGVAVPSPGNNPGLVADCKTLLALKSTLAGTASLNWSVESAMSAWDGVSLGGTPRRVTRLALGRKGLTGSIPPETGSLTALSRLWLSGNRLSGTIPVELTGLTNLTLLVLNGNALVGCVPPSLRQEGVELPRRATTRMRPSVVPTTLALGHFEIVTKDRTPWSRSAFSEAALHTCSTNQVSKSTGR